MEKMMKGSKRAIALIDLDEDVFKGDEVHILSHDAILVGTEDTKVRGMYEDMNANDRVVAKFSIENGEAKLKIIPAERNEVEEI